MTTVVDPNGTPVVVYNRSGTTIVEITASGISTPTAIPYLSGHTIAVVEADGNDHFVLLPAEADIGDLIEIYLNPKAEVVSARFSTGDDGNFGQEEEFTSGVRFLKFGENYWLVGE